MRKALTLLISFALGGNSLTSMAQTGPGGVGNSTGTSGQPLNKLWLRADAGTYTDAGVTPAVNTNQVQQWNDQSGNVAHATQTTVGQRPTYRTAIINGLPVLRFNGTSNQMLFGSALNTNAALPMAFFAVTANTTNPKGLFDSRPGMADVFRFFNDGSGPGANNSVEFHNNNPAKGGLTLLNSGSIVSIMGQKDGSDNRLLDAYITGNQIGSVSTGNNSTVQFTDARMGSINSGADGYFSGDIAEMVYFNTSINAAQRVIVENYLGAKYGLNLTANDFYSNTTFTRNLIGIGTTNGSEKHTTSNDGFGFWLGEDDATLDGTNEFLFSGHNGTAHSVGNNSNLLNLAVIAAGITTRWAREYRIEKTGNLDASFTFDYAQAGLSRASNTGEDFFLLFRSSTGATNFSIVPLKSTADASVPGRVTFRVANADIADGYYTIGLKSQPGPGTLYSYTGNCAGGCDWTATNSWTTDPTGLLLINSRVPRTVDNVTILNGNLVNTQYGIQVTTMTINTGGTLNLGTNTGNTFTTLSGGGRLRISATSGTAVFPTVTTNNFITTAGSTVEYDQNNTFSLPAAPATYRNLVISGGGSKSTTSALTVVETFTIQPPTTFSTSANLTITRNLVNNGQLNQTGGTLFLNGTSAQSLSGTPIATIFNNVTLNGSATITCSIGFTVTGNFTSTNNAVPAFNASTGTVILSSGAAQSIGGAGTGAINFYNFFTSGAGLKTISRSFFVTGTLVVLSGSTLRFPAGGTAYTVDVQNLTNQATLDMATPGSNTTHNLIVRGTLNLVNSSSLNLVNGGNVANLTFAGTTQSVTGGSSPSVVNFNGVTVNAGSTVSLLAYNININTNLTINGTLNLGGYSANRVAAGGTLAVGATGRLIIGGTNTFPTNYGTNTLTTGSWIEYNGTNQTIRSATAYSNLRLAGSGTKTPAGAITVNGTLQQDGGVFALGANNLILGVNGTITAASPSSSNMIQTDGTGVVRKYLDAATSLNIPMGTTTRYTPLQINITAVTLGGAAGSRYYDVRAIEAKAPGQLDNTYSLSKYWQLASTNLSAINVTYTASYQDLEADATAEPVYVPTYFNGTAWSNGVTGDISGRSFSISRTGLTNFTNHRITAGPSVAFIAGTFYSIANGNYEDASSWSILGYGGAPYPIPPTTGSAVSIGDNKTITATAGSKTITTLTIDGSPNPGTLDIQHFTGFTITNFNGSGLLRITATGATATYPTITTNTFNTTAGSRTEYYGSTDYTLPAAPGTYRNLLISGSGMKTLGNTTTINEQLLVDGNLEAANRTFSVMGQTIINGSLTDNNNTGTNTFSGNLTINATGTLSTANGSAFVFEGGITNNGTFSKTGNGTNTFQTNNQILNGSNPITLTGTITIPTGITVTNLNNDLQISGLSIAANGKMFNNFTAFPNNYTGFSSPNTIIRQYNSLTASNDVGNSLTAGTARRITMTRGGAGNIYALKSVAFSSPASALMVQFRVNAGSSGATPAAATMIVGTGFTDDATIHTATSRLQMNLGAGASVWSLTYPDGTPATSATQNGSQKVTWVINRSGATISYVGPSLNGAIQTLANDRADVWMGTTRFATALNLQTATQNMHQLKVVMNGGTGSFTIDSLKVNPIGLINTSPISPTCFKVTPYDVDSVFVNFTSGGGMDANTHFNSDNRFIAQLSNASGSFASAVNIGSWSGTSLSGTINSAIPANTASGIGYRIRVISTSPPSNASDNGTNFNISQFRIAPAPPQSIIPSGSGSVLTATGVNVTSYQWCYYTILGGPITDLPGKTASTYTPYGPDFPGAGTYSIICRMTTSGGCGTNYSNYVVLYINCPPTANMIVNGNFSAGNTGFTSDYTLVVDDPSIQSEMWPEGTYAVNNNPRNLHTNFCNMTTEAMRSPISGGNMLIGNAATTGTVALWRQNITVTPNTDYVLSFYASSLAGTTSSLLFGIYTGCYRTGADVSVPFETFNCQWNKYSFQFNSGASTTIPLEIRNISAAAAGNDIAIDDIELYACASVSSPPFIVANAPYWRGVTSDWFNKDNWGTSCALPGCSDDVYIPLLPSGKVYPIINAAGAAARTVEVRTGAKLTINSGFNLNICGNLDNSGIITAGTNSTLTFTGNQNPALIKGNITGTSKPGNIIINKTNATDTVRLTGNMELTGNFTITNGQFKTGGYNLVLNGNFTNNSTFIHQNGLVEMKGSTNTAISQTGTGSFYNLKINKNAASNLVTFNPAATTVSNQLDLTLGKAVTAGTNEIVVSNPAPNAVINQSANSYVRGRLRRAIAGMGSFDFPVGDASRYELVNINITSPLVGTSSVLGYFNSGTAPGTTPYLIENWKTYDNICANGYWTLTPNAQPSSGFYNFTMYPVGLVCPNSNQTVAKRTNSASSWTFGGSTFVSSTQRNGFSSFSEFGWIDAEDPLPVTLITFNGQWKESGAQLFWQTVKERENSHFEVQRSWDGQHFETIGTVQNKMKLGPANNYDYLDNNQGVGKRYYRLKQVDYNGNFDYSHTIKLEKGIDFHPLMVSPNPVKKGNLLTLRFLENENHLYRVTWVNLAGKKVFESQIQSQEGWNEIPTEVSSKLPPGVYLISLHGPEGGLSGLHPVKIILE